MKVAKKPKVAKKAKVAKKKVAPKTGTVCLESYKISKNGKCVKDKKHKKISEVLSTIPPPPPPPPVKTFNTGIPTPPPAPKFNIPAPPPMPKFIVNNETKASIAKQVSAIARQKSAEAKEVLARQKSAEAKEKLARQQSKEAKEKLARQQSKEAKEVLARQKSAEAKEVLARQVSVAAKEALAKAENETKKRNELIKLVNGKFFIEYEKCHSFVDKYTKECEALYGPGNSDTNNCKNKRLLDAHSYKPLKDLLDYDNCPPPVISVVKYKLPQNQSPPKGQAPILNKPLSFQDQILQGKKLKKAPSKKVEKPKSFQDQILEKKELKKTPSKKVEKPKGPLSLQDQILEGKKLNKASDRKIEKLKGGPKTIVDSLTEKLQKMNFKQDTVDTTQDPEWN